MTRVDMSPEAVTERLREMSRLSDLRTTGRLATKVDMSPGAVTRRLRRQSELRRTCLTWMKLGKAAGGGSSPASEQT
jgi:DNA-binding Lrp family transcriptional regulator